MGWPQYLYLAWAFMALGFVLAMDGKPREAYSFGSSLIAQLLALAILWAGGFFSDAHAQQVPQQAKRWRAELTRAAHAQWGLDAPIAALAAQLHQESGWKPEAVSRVGAQGMAQFMPATATWWCERTGMSQSECQPTNPTWAIRALVGYDHWLSQRARAGDARNRHAFTLSAYNGGEGWVQRDQKLASSKGLDPLVWFGSVEIVNAGRSEANWRENRAYPRRIIFDLQPLYATWGPGV